MNATPIKLGWLLLSAGLVLLIGYSVPRVQFNLLITLYALLFWGYWLRVSPLWRFPDSVALSPDRFLFLSAIFFRLLLLGAMPLLSDDVYRFIWDGRLLAHGYDPYLYLPSRIVGTPMAAISGLNQALFKALNSPNYYTVYPPVDQALFGLAAWLSPVSIQGSVFWLRVPILLAEIGSIGLLVQLLRRFGKNPNLALLYALNPLIILELTGNLHFEAIMIFFGLLAVWLFVTNRFTLSAGALALAIGTKLVPLLLLPLVVGQLGWKQGMRYAALTGLFTVALFLPFARIEVAQNIFSSVDLYFELFEFNASVYYLVREVGFWLTGHSILPDAGVWLSVSTILGILAIAFLGRRPPDRSDAAGRLLLTLTFYFAMATTVHPWYAASLVAVTAFTRFRYPLLWSGLIWLSYATYQTVPYHENLWLTGLSYGLVAGFGVYEWWVGQRAQRPLVAPPSSSSP